jgi:hypothetical protein
MINTFMANWREFIWQWNSFFCWILILPALDQSTSTFLLILLVREWRRDFPSGRLFIVLDKWGDLYT